MTSLFFIHLITKEDFYFLFLSVHFKSDDSIPKEIDNSEKEVLDLSFQAYQKTKKNYHSSTWSSSGYCTSGWTICKSFPSKKKNDRSHLFLYLVNNIGHIENSPNGCYAVLPQWVFSQVGFLLTQGFESRTLGQALDSSNFVQKQMS